MDELEDRFDELLARINNPELTKAYEGLRAELARTITEANNAVLAAYEKLKECYE